jgi:hypothetical protein
MGGYGFIIQAIVLCLYDLTFELICISYLAQNADYEKLSTRLKPVYDYFYQMGRTCKLHIVKIDQLYICLTAL